MIAITQESCNDRIRDYAKRKIQNAGANVETWRVEMINEDEQAAWNETFGKVRS